MPAEADLDPEKIQLTSMRILHGEMKSPFAFDIEKIDRYYTEHQFNLAFRLEDDMVKADFDLYIKTVSFENSNEEEASAKFQLVFFFLVEDLNDLAVVGEDETIDLHGLGSVLASIAYSTTRGILMTRLQGTALAEFILPVIDPNKLLGD